VPLPAQTFVSYPPAALEPTDVASPPTPTNDITPPTSTILRRFASHNVPGRLEQQLLQPRRRGGAWYNNHLNPVGEGDPD